MAAALHHWRRAYGALKDSTTVGLANLQRDYRALDVAIVKATNHVELPPKERHIRTILLATSVARQAEEKSYCVRALARRLARTSNWMVSLKVLIVFHRLLRDGDSFFSKVLLDFWQRGHVMQLLNFNDGSNPIARDCYTWVHSYALHLEEKLECLSVLKYEIETDHLIRPTDDACKSTGHSKQGCCRTRVLRTEELLNQLPALQKLLHRLIECRLEGAVANNQIFHYALALVLNESIKIYHAVNDGIINLVDKFFVMERHQAIKAIEIYKRAVQQAGALSDFYEECRSIDMIWSFQFPQLKKPPHAFLAIMEEYIEGTPTMLSVPRKPLVAEKSPAVEEAKSQSVLSVDKVGIVPQQLDGKDLLGLDFIVDASNIAKNKLLALPAVSYDASAPSKPNAQEERFDLMGWELALVHNSSVRNISGVSAYSNECHAGGPDKRNSDGFYEDASDEEHPSPATLLQQNPFLDSFAVSNQNATTPSLQMGALAGWQPFQTLQMTTQLNSFAPATVPQLHSFNGVALNPFDDLGLRLSAANLTQPQQKPSF